MDRVVLVTDHTWPSLEPEEAVLQRVGARLVVAETGEEGELLALVPEADAILTCFARVSEEVVRAGGRLQVIGRYGIGVDNIAVAEATKLGIPVTNVPAYCLDEVAEHTVGMLLALARGGLVDHDALLRALREGWIAGAGLDVFDPEPLPDGHPLLREPNLVATPHVAFYSEESLVELETLAAENVAAVLEGRMPASVVNPTVLDLQRWEHLRS